MEAPVEVADPSGAVRTGGSSLRSSMVGDGSFRVSGADGDVWFCFFFAILVNTEDKFPVRLTGKKRTTLCVEVVFPLANAGPVLGERKVSRGESEGGFEVEFPHNLNQMSLPRFLD